MADWKKIKAEYVRGKSYRTLADKYGVSFSTIQKRGATEKWTELRKNAGRKADEKIVEAAAVRDAKRVDAVQEVADLLMAKIRSKVDDDDFVTDPKDLRALTAALKDLREIKGYKSDLDLQEQIARIEKLRRDAKVEELNNSVQVVMASGMDEYAE